MKLEKTLSITNQVEKNKFISAIDNLLSQSTDKDQIIQDALQDLNQDNLRSFTNLQIVKIFEQLRDQFYQNISTSLPLAGNKVFLILKILSRDGNAVISQEWLESLYLKELNHISTQVSEVEELLLSQDHSAINPYLTYKNVYRVAFENDLQENREPKISKEERQLLNALASNINLGLDDRLALEHTINPIERGDLTDALSYLRDLGLLFIRRKDKVILVPDECVAQMDQYLEKGLKDKYYRRILRCLSDSELSNILKSYQRRIVGKSRSEKIQEVLDMGVLYEKLLNADMHKNDASKQQVKDRLLSLAEDLDLGIKKIGSTVEQRIEIIRKAITSSAIREQAMLTSSGFQDLFSSLKHYFPDIEQRIRLEFELPEVIEISLEALKDLDISQTDILFLLSNDEVKLFRNELNLPKKKNIRQEIIQNFIDTSEKLVSDYLSLAHRDYAALSAHDASIAEADIGQKFEDATRVILENLGQNVDEDLRHALNTAKDKIDILLSVSDDDVIIVEVKSSKDGELTNYSKISRQIISYRNLCEQAGKRVLGVLLVAPGFSEKFIEATHLEPSVNISLIQAEGLKLILDKYKSKKRPKFTYNLLTKGTLLNAELIVKGI